MARFRIYTAHRSLLSETGIAIISEPSPGSARARMAVRKRVRPYRSLWIIARGWKKGKPELHDFSEPMFVRIRE